VVLNLVLIPHFGIVGSAYAWAISLTLVNLLRVVQVRIVLGMYPFDVGEAKAFVAGGAALVVGLVIGHATDGAVAIVVGGLALGITYLAVLAGLGISADDRLLLQSLRPARAGTSSNGPPEARL